MTDNRYCSFDRCFDPDSFVSMKITSTSSTERESLVNNESRQYNHFRCEPLACKCVGNINLVSIQAFDCIFVRRLENKPSVLFFFADISWFPKESSHLRHQLYLSVKLHHEAIPSLSRACCCHHLSAEDPSSRCAWLLISPFQHA